MSPVMLAVAAAGLALIGRFDRVIILKRRGKMSVLAASIAGDILLRCTFGQGELPVRFSLSVVIGCLLLACITDTAACLVHNFVWWVSSASASALIIGQHPGMEALWELALFCGIQLMLFSRMYGKADCYAFCVCAAAETGVGFGIAGFLLHMLISFLLLAIIQALRRNIASGGRLKRPVPFLPYITAGFYTIIILSNISVKIYSETVVPFS